MVPVNKQEGDNQVCLKINKEHALSFAADCRSALHYWTQLSAILSPCVALHHRPRLNRNFTQVASRNRTFESVM